MSNLFNNQNIHEIKRFLWKHRYQLGVAVTAVVATASVVTVVTYWNGSSSSSSSSSDNRTNQNTSNDSSILFGKFITIKQQFDVASNQIFPTLRIKITEIVDVLQTIRQIKELRMRSDIANNGHADIENSLWEDIKVSSFTLWLMTIYSTCATCLLLRIQLSILARNEKVLTQTSRQDFETLISESYNHLFEKGLSDFVETLKGFVSKHLSDCTVKDKVTYQYDEFNVFVMKARYYFEKEAKDLLINLVIPPDALNTNEESKNCPQDDTFLSKYRNEIWDVIESPMYSVAMTEACDRCFKRHMEILRQDVFNIIPPLDGSLNLVGNLSRVGSKLSSPPLASLLPQLKSLASNLLPTEGIGYEINEIYTGPSIDSLCVTILESKII